MTETVVRPEVGSIEVRSDGEWVVTGSRSESGTQMTMAVRRDSLAHRIIAQQDPRVAAALTGAPTTAAGGGNDG